MELRLFVGCLNALNQQPFLLVVLESMPNQLEAQLTQTLQELARIRRRLHRVNQHKLPIYWSVQPRVFAALTLLEQLLKDDQQTLTSYLPQLKK